MSDLDNTLGLTPEELGHGPAAQSWEPRPGFERPTIEELRLKFGDPRESNEPRKHMIYSHTDGGIYVVLAVSAKDTRDGRDLVIYEHMWPFTDAPISGAGQVYARPRSEWDGRFTWQRADTLYHLLALGDIQGWRETITARKKVRKQAEAAEFLRVQRRADAAYGE